MSILAFVESSEAKIKKNSFEVISYARSLADSLSVELTVLCFNVDNANDASIYGADKIINVKNEDLIEFKSREYADAINQVANNINSKIIVLSGSSNSKYLAPSLAIKFDAGYLSNVVSLPIELNPFIVKRSTFSNKAFSECSIDTERKIIGLATNSFGTIEKKSSPEIIEQDLQIEKTKLRVDSVEMSENKISIADADIVVSAGRGLKGPEHWGIIEDLAKTLGAATACSKPVSDLGWRPHSEHVGQTGKPVSTNLYIAIGISGAIQHLAGVSSSKIKLVINTDPDAPFFKAADYGIVGDAFDVVPRLNEKLRAFKAENN
jgi:electron transfer flavoprotein alpha subunit